ncbi:MAG: fused response regulator/phosphatase [Candidatus Magnetominusculus sp. LBB02]|nr:fused response regulator/phosphatase [Candidatus Magnetominusculus sp. LBB02]
MGTIKVLVIDDDENNRYICEANLRQVGITVFLAEGGKEGLDMAEREGPDLVLLDIMMPGMNGYQVLDALKHNPATIDIPVIMLTAKNEGPYSEVAKTLSRGAADYIRKPYMLPELLARVSNLARKHKLEKERASDLRNAAMMQKKFLTNSGDHEEILNAAGLHAVFYNKAATDISGDFWYAKMMPKGKAGLFVADTCGHGVLAAIMSMRILSIIDHCPAPTLHPSEFLLNINGDIYDLLSPENSFVAGMYLIFDRNKVIFSNAGQPMPFLIRDGKVIELKLPGPPLGVFPELHITEMEHEFKKADRLVIYTDGLFESMTVQGEPIQRMTACLERACNLPLEDMKNNLVSEMQDALEGEFDDDVTVIIIERQE